MRFSNVSTQSCLTFGDIKKIVLMKEKILKNLKTAQKKLRPTQKKIHWKTENLIIENFKNGKKLLSKMKIKMKSIGIF